jgi:dihydroxyacetone kinase-like predicted kinase
MQEIMQNMSRKESILKRINKDLDKEIKKKQNIISILIGEHITYQHTSKIVSNIIEKTSKNELKKYF